MENTLAETRRTQPDGLAERETVLQWDLLSDQVTCWTADPHEANRWKRYGWPVEVTGIRRGKPEVWTAKVPRRCIRYAQFIKPKRRELTAEQLQAKQEALRKAREARDLSREQTKQTEKGGSEREPSQS